jgi:hypothetical protein
LPTCGHSSTDKVPLKLVHLLSGMGIQNQGASRDKAKQPVSTGCQLALQAVRQRQVLLQRGHGTGLGLGQQTARVRRWAKRKGRAGQYFSLRPGAGHVSPLCRRDIRLCQTALSGAVG